MDELVIKERLLQKDETVFEELMDEYSKLMWVIAARLIGSGSTVSPFDIEEIISDVFLHLWQKPERFDPLKGTIKSLLVVMTKSRTIDKIRKDSKGIVVEMDNYQEPLEDNSQINGQQVYQIIQTEFKEPAKEVLIRRFFYEEKPQQIVKLTGLSSKEVDNILYRGRQKIQSIILREVN